jgi:biotin carboxylase
MSSPRLLLLASKMGYQTRSFVEAARRLGVEVIIGSDRCHQLDDPWSDGAVPLHFEQPELAAQQVVQALPVPQSFDFRVSDAMEVVLPRVTFPCVLKPLRLSASQGVIRANDLDEFRAAVARIAKLLSSAEVQVTREPDLNRILVESYIPGGELALEGLLVGGELRVLALFDKPDPLEGPYFEESIYSTPSRRSSDVQELLFDCARRAVRALGLTEGPIHAEFRFNEAGPWVLEASPRPIGGLCSRVLRFGPDLIGLEELLVRHAVGLPGADLERESQAAGVMMIPVPASGVLEEVAGEDEAAAVPGIEEIHITARLYDFIAAWPEGSSYLGFIFARAETPQEVELALRRAHAALCFRITPRLPVAPAG